MRLLLKNERVASMLLNCNSGSYSTICTYYTCPVIHSGAFELFYQSPSESLCDGTIYHIADEKLSHIGSVKTNSKDLANEQ